MIDPHESHVLAGFRRHLSRLEAPVVAVSELERRSRTRTSSTTTAIEGLAVVIAAAAVGAFLLGRPSVGGDGAQRLGLPVAPTARPGTVAICNQVLLVGTIQGSEQDPRHAWVLTESGSRVEVSWPAGFTARFAPSLEVLAPDDRVVAKEADEVHLGGSYDEDGGVFNVCRTP